MLLSATPPTSSISVISVIVPVLNESRLLDSALAALRSRRESESGLRVEICVVDGGSADGSVEIASRHADRVLSERGGLARQLNAGAEAAAGEVLLFLYADTRLPAGAFGAIAESLADSAVAGGAFRLELESPRRRYRLIAAGVRLRNRLGLGPFGDQAIFLRRALFAELAGFRPDALLPDLDLVRRLRRRGRFLILPLAVRSSVRRWEELGFAWTCLAHWSMTAAWLFGARRGARCLSAWKRFLLTRRGQTPS